MQYFTIKESDDKPHITLKEQENLLTFNVRQTVPFNIKGDMRNTPFDNLACKMELTLRGREVETEDNQRISYSYNLHTNNDTDGSFGFKKDSDQMREFDIDYSLTKVDFNEDDKKDQKKVFKYSASLIFSCSLYRLPEPMIISLFFPLIVLDILANFIYLQNYEIGSRLGNIATIVLAVLAYQHVFRTNIPIQAYITFGDKYMFGTILTLLLGALEATQDYLSGGIFYRSIFFYISCSITLWKIFSLAFRYMSYRRMLRVAQNARKQESSLN